jgi:hypothetical protein
VLKHQKDLTNINKITNKSFSKYIIFRIKIKSGFYDDKKVILKPNKIWTGTETRNSYKNWNVSVAI